MIIETSDNRFYRVTECTDATMAHLYHGLELTRHQHDSGFVYLPKKTRAGKESWTYVRKAATRIVEQ